MIATMTSPGIYLTPMAAWARFGDALRSSRNPAETQEIVPYFVAIAVVVAGIFLYTRRKNKNDMTLPCNDPAKLFRELCLAHQLTGTRQKLLQQLANAAFPDQPAQIFLSPSAFRDTALPLALASHAGEFRELKSSLFGSASATTSAQRPERG